MRLDAYAAASGLTRDSVLRAALDAQAEYQQRVICRRLDGGPGAHFYRQGFHEHAAADHAWTIAQFRNWIERES